MQGLARLLRTVLSVAAVLAFVGIFLPDHARVQREVFIEAMPGKVFELVNSFRGYTRWSPWVQRDTRARFLVQGPGEGVGATVIWSSRDPGLGSGKQTIVASEPFRLVRTELASDQGGQAASVFELTPVSGGTLLRWRLEKEFGFRLHQRYQGLLLDERAGPELEAGLANIKRLLEPPGPVGTP